MSARKAAKRASRAVPVSAEIARAGKRIGRAPAPAPIAEDDVLGPRDVVELVRELSPSADPFRVIPDVGACLHDVRALAHSTALGGGSEAEILRRAIHAAVAELELVADRFEDTPEETVLLSIVRRLDNAAEFARVASKILDAEKAEATKPRKAVTR